MLLDRVVCCCCPLFKHCPLLQPYATQVLEFFASFQQYKIRVPVCGGIILNQAMDKVCMARHAAALGALVGSDDTWRAVLARERLEQERQLGLSWRQDQQGGGRARLRTARGTTRRESASSYEQL